ncbi:protein adenylyltransferase SelO [Niallia endozanthoxylica]|uniref:Protein nucleotidyltransferase YdiU n=1 Tax=Niallia endozanthoxylica TaxID=2036016 RepID=A0A5J5GWC3_9BACI|nr:YdiU family protein [Niallia endozanthoxylica]KAA9011873.1 YdiU family protein [Niallia endozanthoxylica]
MINQNTSIETGWNFDNSYARLPRFFFNRQNPIPVKSPALVVLNEQLAASLGLDVQSLKNEENINMFAGNQIPEGAAPLAQAYAGHQFGHFNMLGDGRAVLLGEQIDPNGDRFDIQLKGSGRTPFSRGGDGRAALGPMLREYIISEAMHALGVPTTRSLAIVTTGETIIRETMLPGAILTRVAASHVRVGTFQYAAAWGKDEELKAMADYTIKRHYPDIEIDDDRYLTLLREVMKRQAALIAKWMQIGFIHGVMNTDNMAISGETIDYGPCAFMDTYDPATVFSSIDREGRYAYGNQPMIGGWNLARFAETLLPLLHDDEEKAVEIAQEELSGYMEMYQSYWLSGMREKLGIMNEEQEDQALIDDLLHMMQKHRADFTNTFRALTLDRPEVIDMKGIKAFDDWYAKWKARLDRQEGTQESAQQLMRSSNPSVIPRNHRVEEALKAAVEQNDFSVMEKLVDVLSKPFAHSPEHEEYCKLPDATNIPYRTFCGT